MNINFNHFFTQVNKQNCIMREFNLRTPITYYGGKQKLVRTIVGFMPEHKMYVEPFLGGAAVYFGKQASDIEVINTTTRKITNKREQFNLNY
jgi:DNA adenine methylase